MDLCDLLVIQNSVFCELLGVTCMLCLCGILSRFPCTSCEVNGVNVPIIVTSQWAASSIGSTVSLTILLAFPFPPIGLTRTNTLFREVTSTQASQLIAP